MRKYMFRRPEFLKGAGIARFMPNTVQTLLITAGVFLVYLIAAVIVMAVYFIAAAGGSGLQSITDLASSQNAVVFSLYLEAVLIILTAVYVRFIEKRPLATIGLTKRFFALHYAAGYALGFVLLALTAAPTFMTTAFKYTGFSTLAAAYFGGFIVQSAAEETLFRGYLLTSLLRRGGVVWAVLISSAVFALLHIPGSDIGAFNLFSVFLLGVFLAIFMLRTGSLWGAMGLHAAWNFFTGSIASIPVGTQQIDYAFFFPVGTMQESVFDYAVPIIIFLGGIALLLFAGKNRLVVRKTHERRMYETALSLAKKAYRGERDVRGKPYINYVFRVAELAEGEEAKAAALLLYAYGSVPADILSSVFSEDVLAAVGAMRMRPDDDMADYNHRVALRSISARVIEADDKLGALMRAEEAKRAGILATDVLIRCPMFPWSISPERCNWIVKSIDEGRPPKSDPNLGAVLDKDVCISCPNRGLRKAAKSGK